MRWAGGAGGNSPGKTLGFCAEGGDLARIPLGMCGTLEFGERRKCELPVGQAAFEPTPTPLVSLTGPPPSSWCLSSPS